ncbi:MAG: single-stranded-DNA-specific exonuclease RecJ [Candidatus Krumholzibacteriota bacterium]|nr:single-stranded-DNA-specific exonuclease RecJ [Candidatus Krumholzibacteriota bacterium]
MKSWVIDAYAQSEKEGLSRALNISPLEAQLLLARGLTGSEQASRFLAPRYDNLHDPFLFREMESAVGLLSSAIRNNERILIHGDYDADGICGAAMLYETLSKLSADVHYFVPDRAKDGYGLAPRVMERGVQTGLKLLLSVDCGSSDSEVISSLADNGVKTIITDHHEIAERPPRADAFLNPKVPGETYPFSELAGIGVAFKLLQGLEKSMDIDLELESKLDLVALGTLGDYMILRDENRALVTLGLNRMKEWKRRGLESLRKESNLSPDYFTARQVCFTLIPRLNSPGRISSAREAVNLLVTEDEAEASRIAASLEEKNTLRRALDRRVTEEASYLADVIVKRNDPHALVFSSSSWHEGVVGIGASRLAEKYNLPCVLIAVHEKTGKGSARSSRGVNIKEALEYCSRYLQAFGGHKEAGGFSIPVDNISDFNRRFNEFVGKYHPGAEAEDMIKIDAEISLQDCTLDLIAFIRLMAPFGPGNPEPLFLLRGLEILPGSRIVGKDHLKILARDKGGREKDLIGFSLGRAWNPLDIQGKKLDLIVSLRKSVYQGRIEAQVQVSGIRFAEEVIPI